MLAHSTTVFRVSPARADYSIAARIDVQFASNDVCRWMAHPPEHAWSAVRRMCRYLDATLPLVYGFAQQSVYMTPTGLLVQRRASPYLEGA